MTIHLFLSLDLFFLFISSHGLMMLLLLLLIISFYFDFLISFHKSLCISWLNIFIILNCIVLLLLLYQFLFFISTLGVFMTYVLLIYYCNFPII